MHGENADICMGQNKDEQKSDFDLKSPANSTVPTSNITTPMFSQNKQSESNHTSPLYL